MPVDLFGSQLQAAVDCGTPLHRAHGLAIGYHEVNGAGPCYGLANSSQLN